MQKGLGPIENLGFEGRILKVICQELTRVGETSGNGFIDTGRQIRDIVIANM